MIARIEAHLRAQLIAGVHAEIALDVATVLIAGVILGITVGDNFAGRYFELLLMPALLGLRHRLW